MTYVCFAPPLRSMTGRHSGGGGQGKGPRSDRDANIYLRWGLLGREWEGRVNEKDAFGYWQVAAKQRGEACVKISLGKLCTTLDHETLHVGIRVSCHISSSTTNPSFGLHVRSLLANVANKCFIRYHRTVTPHIFV